MMASNSLQSQKWQRNASLYHTLPANTSSASKTLRKSFSERKKASLSYLLLTKTPLNQSQRPPKNLKQSQRPILYRVSSKMSQQYEIFCNDNLFLLFFLNLQQISTQVFPNPELKIKIRFKDKPTIMKSLKISIVKQFFFLVRMVPVSIINPNNNSHLMKSQNIDQVQRRIFVKNLALQTKIGSAVSKWTKLASRNKNRYLRFKELVTTQLDYQKDLITIRDNIKRPLLQAGLILQMEANVMFPNIEAMIQLSVQLRQELQAKFNKWDRRSTEIGKTMIKFSKFMLVYSDYFKNLATTQNKIKNLLSHNQKAKDIEKRLSNQTKIVTFEDMISKPFQRPLKYHLILRDYQSKTPKEHPDMPYLKQAIECFHKVNQKNNVSMQNKQKDQVLIALDSKFGNIIVQDARSYIAQFEGFLIDEIVDLYLFSDLLIIAFKGIGNHQPPLRIHLDKYSYVEKPGDGRCFVNRLFLFGRRTCVHLTFLSQYIRNNFQATIGQVISGMNQNEAVREQKLNQKYRSTRKTLLERRISFTQLSPQNKRPFIISVIGNDQRIFAEDRTETYFVLEITATPQSISSNKSPPRQVSIISFQTLNRIEQLTKRLYPDVTFYPLNYCPKGFSPKDIEKDQDKRFEIINIFVQLMLNTIYRDPNVTKRIDFYSYLLQFSESIWENLKTPNSCAQKQCQACCSNPKFESYEEFYNQLRKRYMQKYKLSVNRIAEHKTKQIQFCDRNTINMIQAAQQVPTTKLTNLLLEARLEWIKCRLGYINHIFTSPKPSTTKINVKVAFCDLLNPTYGMQVQFYSSQRVKQILNYISERLQFSLEDYTLVAVINNKSYILWQDEQLARIIIPPPREQGVFSSFFAKQPYRIVIWLRKILYFNNVLQVKCPQRKLHHKLEQFMFRIKYGEIKLRDLKQYSRIYAWYYCFKHFIELDTLTYYLIKKRTQQLDKILPERMRERIIDALFNQIQKIKVNKAIHHQNQLAEMIILAVTDNQTGSCYFFDTLLKPDNIRVKIGCDYAGIKVRDKSNLLLCFRFSSPTLNYYASGYNLIISDQRTYNFYSNDSWMIKKQADLYKLYYSCFKS